MESELVSLVIPGRNAERTIRSCLDAVVSILKSENSRLAEIIFVDDGSTDQTARIVAAYPVRCLSGPGGGPGAARNIGWRAASHPLVWFIDSDCVAQPDALALLLPHMNDPRVGGVGGSYGNMSPDSILACLIHEEILQRHRAMPTDVNFLGGFNVLYRRKILEQLGGFDEKHYNGPGSPGAEDAELSYRVHEAGHTLHFEPRSIVRHFHPTRLGRYLRSQRHHGYWRVFLHLRHRRKAAGDAYSDLLDHVQPVLAMASIASLPSLFLYGLERLPHLLLLLLFLAQLPRTARLVAALQQPKYLLMAPLGFFRAFWRGFGMTQGALTYLFNPNRT